MDPPLKFTLKPSEYLIEKYLNWFLLINKNELKPLVCNKGVNNRKVHYTLSLHNNRFVT